MERAHNLVRIRKNFMFSHWKANITILQEGPVPLMRCDNCVMHIPEDRLEKHKQTSRYEISMDMRMRRRDVEFSLYGRGWSSLLEEVSQLKYLGQNLDQSNNYWPEFRQNIRRAWKVWIWLGEIFRREETDTKMSAMFYQEVAKVVMLFI